MKVRAGVAFRLPLITGARNVVSVSKGAHASGPREAATSGVLAETC